MSKFKNQKTRMLFSISPGVAEEFRYHAKRNKENMSKLIEKWMHNYSVRNAET